MPPVTVLQLSSPAKPVSSMPAKDGGVTMPDLTRLPKTVLPKRYELKLTCDPATKQYTGQVNIRLYFHDPSPTQTVWLHSKGLNITEASIRFSQFSLPVEALKVIAVPDKEAIGVHFANGIDNGTRAWLTLGFCGSISNNLEGFFSTPYVDKTGARRLGAATMFAATEARSCFPCFDEPDFKAVFALEVTVPSDLMVISNMPVMDTVVERGGSLRTDYFEWTKEMSSYLVCIVIGQYDFMTTTANKGRTIVRVFTPIGQREHGRFALNVAKKSLEFFNDYFGKSYPLPKLDLVALSRLSVGAMENWGVITCREAGMITENEGEANPCKLQRVATLIAHEISHQWFGNLVTMRWWDGLYLNEGFATLMQYICVDQIYPEYEVFNRFCADTVIPALGLDALRNSHPIEQPLKDSSEISQVFDKITYCKGASVLFMLHEFLGGQIFKEAIQEYMQQFSYDNATTEDLWQFLSAASNKDVGSIMKEWIRELGFPVVTASHYIGENGDFILQLQQERFSNAVPDGGQMIWNIPLRGLYVKQGEPEQPEKIDVLFNKSSAEIKLKGYNSEDPGCWLKLNPGLTGFYRVQYSEPLFDHLISNLQSPHLSATDRMGLFDDQVAMVLSEGGCTTRILKMVQMFKDFESSATVWRSVAGIMHQIATLTWPTEETANQFEQFVAEMFRPVLARVGMHQRPEESHNDSMLRCVLFNALGGLGDPEVNTAAKEMFQAHLEETVIIPAGSRDAVFRAVMTTANQQTLDQILMLFREAELADDRVVLLGALGCAKDPNILQQVLEFSLSSEVHPQEALSTLVVASSNRFGYKHTWTFFMNNIDQLLERYLGGLFLLSKLLKAVTESFTDSEGYESVSEFFALHRGRFVGSEHAVEQAEEHVRLNCVWRDNDISKVQMFLDRYSNT